MNTLNAKASLPAPTAPTAPVRRSTDAPTRMFHALFALSFAGAYLTADSERWRLVHVSLGYAMAGLLAWRVLYGLLGPRQVRLGLLWRKLSGLPAWLRGVWASPSTLATQRRQGQNLAMALAIAMMLLLTVPLVLSGHASHEQWAPSWGDEWLEDVHEFFANAFLAVVLAHLAMLALLSLLRRQNMARPMLTGRLDGSGPSPVQANRTWLAALILLAWLGWAAWQWQSAPQVSISGPGALGTMHKDSDDD